MNKFIFESPFPTTEEGLRHLVFGDRKDIFSTTSKEAFLQLSEADKNIIKKFEISDDEISIELHDAVEASVIYSRMMNIEL
ncbi:hypothetical protein CGK40_23260 [Vibrio parahaemolyticus]|uniref:hypothetical protein n=1 Tax=Vibrio parahaemolyticus TaxID=670 RepID=UPI00111FC4E7|nr:hypothetical protein [Vibrio parahaemolyticus]TNZ87517.1 hypothetical protein CGK40_23260 [Vibrio parahaemolyticus]